MVSSPVTTQTISSQPAEPTWRAISAGTMKMPEPIIEPATIMVESSSPSSRTNPVVCFLAARSASRRCFPACARFSPKIRFILQGDAADVTSVEIEARRAVCGAQAMRLRPPSRLPQPAGGAG